MESDIIIQRRQEAVAQLWQAGIPPEHIEGLAKVVLSGYVDWQDYDGHVHNFRLPIWAVTNAYLASGVSPKTIQRLTDEVLKDLRDDVAYLSEEDRYWGKPRLADDCRAELPELEKLFGHSLVEAAEYHLASVSTNAEIEQ